MPKIRSAVKKLVKRPLKDGAEDSNRAAAAAEASTAQIEIPESTQERSGLFELFHPPLGQNVDIDVVAVHGIGGDWKGTWTKNQKLWLRDFLPGNLQSDDPSNNINARILSYGYESEYFVTRGTTGISEAADSLLDGLNGKRLSGCERRPIIFVAHSLGGIVFKKAMNNANITPEYENLKDSIIGVIFLGVSHRGADIATWGTAITEAMKTVSIGTFGSTELLKALKKDSDQLRHISDDWKHGIGNLKIRTFYETKKLGPTLVVPQSSARLDFPGEKCLPVSDSDHRSMCRFDEDDTQRYEPLGRAVRDLARIAVGITELNLTKKPLSKEESECLQALKTSDYEDYIHRANTPPRVPGTCQWCVRDERYNHWRGVHDSSILWVSADPGCGKSVLASYLVDQLKSSESQLILPGADFHSLWRVFKNATADPSCPNVVCIIDALDECQEPTKDLLIGSLRNFFAKRGVLRNSVKFILTSRPYPLIERKFCNFQEINLARLSGEEKIVEIVEDIDTVIQERVNDVSVKHELSEDDKRELVLFLTSNAKKTFLWVSLVLNDIEKNDDFDIFDIIENTPPSIYSYYENMLNKISDRPRAEKIFRIVLAARRPLTLEEMNYAYSINLSTPDSIKLRSNIKRTIKGLCGLLLQVIDNEIHFIHQTAKEFLQYDVDITSSGSNTWRHSLHSSESNIILARICITYLLSTVLKSPLLEKRETSKSWVLPPGELGRDKLFSFRMQHAFIDYASTYWSVHFREAQQSVEPNSDLMSMVLSVCDVKSVLYHTWWLFFSRGGYYHIKPSNILTLSSRLGLDIIIRRLLEDGADIEARDGPGDRGPTALHIATDYRHKTTVQLLVENGANIEARSSSDNSGETALLLAARHGHEAIAQLLIEKSVDIEARNGSKRYGSMALHLATEHGHEAVVRLLLENGADTEARNSSGSSGSTAIHSATRYGYEAIVRLLIANGADTGARDGSDIFGSTAIHLAARYGHEAIVRLLLDNGADIGAKASFGATALHCAAGSGHEAKVRLLIENGADIEANDDSGTTALHWAAEYGREAVVQLLIENGADIEANENLGRTPLFEALRFGTYATVQLLLKNHANIHAKDNRSLTALHHAALEGNLDIFRLLLETGADINAKDDVGRTVTALAACDQDEALIKELQEQELLFPPSGKDDDSLSSTEGWEGRKAILQFIK